MSLRAVVLGYQAIKCGDSTIVIAGGQESMSNAPHVVSVRSGVKMGNTELMDTMIHDGLTDAFDDIHMGITGKKCSKYYIIVVFFYGKSNSFIFIRYCDIVLI